MGKMMSIAQLRVCPKCQVELSCVRIGVVMVAMTITGPYSIVSADLYQCPGCLMEVVLNYQTATEMHHFQDGFAERLAVYEQERRVIKFWMNEMEKQEYEASHPLVAAT